MITFDDEWAVLWERVRSHSACDNCGSCVVYDPEPSIGFCTHKDVMDFVDITDARTCQECDLFDPIDWAQRD